MPCYYSSLEDLLDASEDMIIAQGQHSAWSAGYRFEVVRYKLAILILHRNGSRINPHPSIRIPDRLHSLSSILGTF